MAQIQYIKHLWEQENKSLREISKVTGLNFRTVQKYAYQDDFTPQAKPPIRIGERHPVLGPYISIIDQWMEADLKEPRKQRHTVTRIFSRLQSEHKYRGSYGSVKDYVRKRKLLMGTDKQAGFLPLEHLKAHAQVDFGQFKYYDRAGEAQTGHALTISFPYSNAAFTQVFPSENQECLLEGMKRIFQHIGGAPIRIKADNMTTAVSQILENSGRVLSDGYARFMLHYRFETDFCSPGAGNEKGNVENKVGYTRRNFLVPAPTIGDFESFNLELFHWCETDMDRKHYKQGKDICDLWEDEKRQLLSLPSQEYKVIRYKTARVDNYGLVILDTNRYSVSSELAGQAVQLYIHYDKVEMYHDHRLITTHTRCYGKNQDVLDWRRHVNLWSLMKLALCRFIRKPPS